MKKTISSNIQMLRASKGYSQEYVANMLGLTQQAYSMMEQNPDKIPLKRLHELSTILQVKIVALIGEDDSLSIQNSNRHKSQVGTQSNNKSSTISAERELYERYIAELREEIQFLRELLKAKYSPKNASSSDSFR
jgi:transcriptional regulator with XRE-family HTH domain